MSDKNVGNKLKNAADDAGTAAKNAAKDVKTGVQNAANKAGNEANKAANNAKAHGKGALDKAGAAVKNTVGDIKTSSENAVNSAKNDAEKAGRRRVAGSIAGRNCRLHDRVGVLPLGLRGDFPVQIVLVAAQDLDVNKLARHQAGIAPVLDLHQAINLRRIGH